jgi:hypothetical protein
MSISSHSSTDKVFTLKYLQELELKSENIQEVAHYLDKCYEYSKILNERMGYVSGIRYVQFIHIKVKQTFSGKCSSLIFVDLPDHEKLQTNINDH